MTEPKTPGYDLFANIYDSNGLVLQVDYATKAVDISQTVIGLRSDIGIVLVAENIITCKLVEPDNRIYYIDENIGMAIAGYLADGKAIVDIARKEAIHFYKTHNRHIPLKILNERLSSYMHAYTLGSSVRPFGVFIILVSCTKEEAKPEMYMIEPSGATYGYFGCANGKTKELAVKKIEALENLASMNKEELVEAAKTIIHEIRGNTENKFVLEMYYIGRENKFKFLKEEIDDVA